LIEEPKKIGGKLVTSNSSQSIWRTETPEPTVTKFCMWCGDRDTRACGIIFVAFTME